MNYNPKPFENLLKRYLLRQAAEIDKLIDMYIRQLVLQSTRVNPPEDTEFEFRNYPSLSRAVDRTLRTMSNSITGTIQSGIEWAWDLANAKNDDMVARIVRSIGAGRIPQDALARWNQKNLPALEAFQQRKFSGMSLSDRVWDFSRGIKGDLELALDLGIGEGMSADGLARQVKGFLKEPNRLYRRVRDEKGILRLSQAGSNYHPGQGVYRSSYKNAKRLAGTETNIAYRSADHERVQQLDFILGIEVHLSKNHTCLNAKGEPEPFYDICDELQGRYPKDFKFVGWHPNCYDDKSEVYTSNGWKPFAEVNEHDHILTLNPDTLDLEYTDYKMKFASWYEGEMTHFHNRSYSQLVTPDHEVLCLDKNSREPIFKRITARKCGKSQPIYRSSRWNGKYINSIQIGSLNVDFCRFCEFMGYWLSDGSLGHKWEVGIAQQDTHREAIFDCISALGMRPRYNGGKVEFNSEDWYKYLEPFGKCADKFVPTEIKEATPEQIKVFLDAFISCDGYIRPPKSFVGSHGNTCEPKESERTYFTTSKRLADDIGELILKIGRRPSFKLNKAAGRKQQFYNGEYIINYDCWIISECRSVTATQYNKDVVYYKGWVYDLVLEKNATMYIRREGKCFWGSNCRCYTTTILPSEDEFFAYLDEMDDNGNSTYEFKNQVTGVPSKMTKWLEENEERIKGAKSLPYWIKDNPQIAISEDVLDKINYEKLKDNLRNQERNGIPKDTPTITDELRQRYSNFMIKGSDEFDFEEELFEKYDSLVKPTADNWIMADSAQKHAMVDYTDGEHWYGRVNAVARKQNVEPDPEAAQKVIDMERFILGCRTKEEMVFRRGTGYGEIEKVFGEDVLRAILSGDNSAIGQLGVQRGFTSTSFNEFGGYHLGRTLDTKVEMRILAPKGTQAAFAKVFSRNDMVFGSKWGGELPADKIYLSDAENEMILNRNMLMRIEGYEVIDAEKGWIRVLVSILGRV